LHARSYPPAHSMERSGYLGTYQATTALFAIFITRLAKGCRPVFSKSRLTGMSPTAAAEGNRGASDPSAAMTFTSYRLDKGPMSFSTQIEFADFCGNQ
ncbi:hypothetical protein, partial [Collinsella stercoris]|uniref:hypothetical protein n=1 Tax=Collinsella stercoris TaxID=147206 RepID=UPI003AF1095E